MRLGLRRVGTRGQDDRHLRPGHQRRRLPPAIFLDTEGRGNDAKHATVVVHGSAGPGTAENMMSGQVIVKGDASQYAGATGRGGLLVVKGNAASRCGISMKGIDIVVHGNIGHMSCFMAQSGNLVVLGDAASGTVASPGTPASNVTELSGVPASGVPPRHGSAARRGRVLWLRW